MGSLCAARVIASFAVARSTPAISNITRPGFTTATHFSGAPFPFPMRVSAGFLVNGLSGKIPIQSFSPRLMKRVMATREASICGSVIHAGSSALRPYSPKESSPPRQALPLRRPRCCFRYFTFFGINIVVDPYTLPSNNRRALICRCQRDNLFHSALRNIFTLIHPALHADHAVGRVRLGKTKIDVRAKRLQGQPALQVPFLARDFRAVQTAGDANLDPLASEAQGRVHRLAHGPAEGYALLQLQRDRFGDQLRVQLRPVNFLDVDMNFALGALLNFSLELVDFRALASNDDSRTGREHANYEFVGGAFD